MTGPTYAAEPEIAGRVPADERPFADFAWTEENAERARAGISRDTRTVGSSRR